MARAGWRGAGELAGAGRWRTVPSWQGWQGRHGKAGGLAMVRELARRRAEGGRGSWSRQGGGLAMVAGWRDPVTRARDRSAMGQSRPGRGVMVRGGLGRAGNGAGAPRAPCFPSRASALWWIGEWRGRAGHGDARRWRGRVPQGFPGGGRDGAAGDAMVAGRGHWWKTQATLKRAMWMDATLLQNQCPWPLRVAGATGRRNTGVKSFCWGFVLQGLPWPLIELTGGRAGMSASANSRHRYHRGPCGSDPGGSPAISPEF
jgi:hypothetical protein